MFFVMEDYSETLLNYLKIRRGELQYVGRPLVHIMVILIPLKRCDFFQLSDDLV